MHFQSLALLSLTTLSLALPAPFTPRQAGGGGGVLQATTYNAISISGGKAGNAQAEAAARFAALDVNNPAAISKADQDFLDTVNQVANDAEKQAFNPAVEAATGDEAAQLQNGKIKNKVLKLMATVLKLQAQQAQGQDVADKLAEETTKLNTNVGIDEENAGQASTALDFDADISS